MAYEKTLGLVLHQIKYGDTSLIVHYFTREHGRLAVMVKGARNRKSKFKAALFQALELHQLDIAYRENHNFQHLREVRILHPELVNVQDFNKMAVKLFLAEVLYRTLREEVKNEELFDFLESALLLFAGLDAYSNFHLVFLLRLSRFLGFFPGNLPPPSDVFFDLREGEFVSTHPFHDYIINPEYSEKFSQLLFADLQSAGSIQLSRQDRAYLLDQILLFYRLHFDGFGQLRSLEVLKSLFD